MNHKLIKYPIQKKTSAKEVSLLERIAGPPVMKTRATIEAYTGKELKLKTLKATFRLLNWWIKQFPKTYQERAQQMILNRFIGDKELKTVFAKYRVTRKVNEAIQNLSNSIVGHDKINKFELVGKLLSSIAEIRPSCNVVGWYDYTAGTSNSQDENSFDLQDAGTSFLQAPEEAWIA